MIPYHAIVFERDELWKEDAEFAHDADGDVAPDLHAKHAIDPALERKRRHIAAKMDNNRIHAGSQWILHLPPLVQAVAALCLERFDVSHRRTKMQSVKKDFDFIPDSMEEVRIGRYRHYKGGEYDVLDVARHSENKEELVIYRALVDGTLWARPKRMFLEKISDGKSDIPRFTFMK